MSSVVGNGISVCAGLLVLFGKSRNLTLANLGTKLGQYRRSQIAERDQDGETVKNRPWQ